MRNRVVLVVLVLLVASACQWTHYRGGPTLAGVQTGELTIDPANVSTLVEQWRSPAGTALAAPTVADSRVHVTEGTWPVATGPGCSGTPTTCAPSWTLPVDYANPFASPTLAFGSSFVLPMPMSQTGFATFDAAGIEGCDTTATTCAPRWTTTTDPYTSASAHPDAHLLRGTGSPTVAGSTVFAADTTAAGPRLYAFDASGAAGCSGVPAVCEPLWATDERVFPLSVAVDGGNVYAIEDGPFEVDAALRVYDADGSAGCSGTPTICKPLWSGDFGVHADGAIGWTSPVVDGIVYAIIGSTILAFASDGGPTCSGTPVVCQPLWTAGVPGSYGIDLRAPAVADGLLLVPTHEGVIAFDATGSASCGGVPKTCDPLHYYLTASLATSATVANGVLYVGGDDGLFAFDLDATACAGDFPLCEPIWHALEGQWASSPAVVNGHVHVTAGSLVTFGLP